MLKLKDLSFTSICFYYTVIFKCTLKRLHRICIQIKMFLNYTLSKHDTVCAIFVYLVSYQCDGKYVFIYQMENKVGKRFGMGIEKE